MKKKKKAAIIISILVFLIATSWIFFFMKTVRYNVSSEKITQPIKIVFISDLHNCFYGGTDNSQLTDTISKENPDIVLFGGDVIDFMGGSKYALELMKKINSEYPCAYTPGNHEEMRDDNLEFYDEVRKLGVPLLLGDRLDLDIKGQKISIFGVIDSFQQGIGKTQIENCYDVLDSERYNILLAHQPEQYKDYMNPGSENRTDTFDMILSGHAHGGQWAVPKILEQGLYAPDQGILPDRTKGMYEMDGTVQIVSRGLAKPLRMIFIPRYFNNPELTVIEIE